MRYIFSIFIIFAFIACEDDDYPVRFDNDQIIRLLTREKNKFWTPVSNTACEQDNVIIFSIAEDDKTQGSYRLKKGSELCADEAEEDIVGSWEILSNGGLDRLAIYTSDTLTYEIILLTSEHLHLRNADSEWKLLAI